MASASINSMPPPHGNQVGYAQKAYYIQGCGVAPPQECWMLLQYRAPMSRLVVAGCCSAGTLRGVARLALPEVMIEIEATSSMIRSISSRVNLLICFYPFPPPRRDPLT